jgi:hypothetical protein
MARQQFISLGWETLYAANNFFFKHVCMSCRTVLMECWTSVHREWRIWWTTSTEYKGFLKTSCLLIRQILFKRALEIAVGTRGIGSYCGGEGLDSTPTLSSTSGARWGRIIEWKITKRKHQGILA